jgi:hypothetical protein
VTNTFARNVLGFANFVFRGFVITNFGTLSLTNSTLAENTSTQELFPPRFASVIFGATNASEHWP